MKCIAVYPILKTTFSEMLTYWTMLDYKTGDLIQVPLQNRKVWAIVDSVLSVSEAKEFIKSQTFTIRKITEQVTSDFFSHEFILSCLHASRHYICPFGEVMSEVVPKHVLLELGTGKQKVPVKKEKVDVRYIQNSFLNRIAEIKMLLHERQDKMTCIIAPTVESATHISSHISGAKLMHGSLGLKRQKELIKDTGVIVITPIYLYLLDFLDIDFCIMELAGSEYYRHLRKRIDFRYIIRQFAERKKITLIESDALLPVYRDTLVEGGAVTFALPKDPDMYIVDQTLSPKAKVKDLRISKKARPEDMADVKEIVGLRMDVVTHKKLQLITPELFSLIKYCEKNNASLLLYTVRKGLSSQIICKDCQHLFICDACQKSYTIKMIDGHKRYVCPLNHDPKPINTPCPTCNGIHLQLIGAGTEAIAKELANTTTLPIEIIDGDVSTPTKAKKLLKFYAAKKTTVICIGTELLLNQSHEVSFDYSAVVSLETLLALPSQFAELDAARVINRLVERTTKSVVIQTRNPLHVIWGCIAKKNWLPLYTQVRQDSKALNLPPWSVHIQLSIPLIYEKRKEESMRVYEYIKQFGTVRTHTEHDKITHHLFLDTTTYPDEYLLSYLKTLPQYIRIEVDSPQLL